jgi:hypothetical protein
MAKPTRSVGSIDYAHLVDRTAQNCRRAVHELHSPSPMARLLAHHPADLAYSPARVDIVVLPFADSACFERP